MPATLTVLGGPIYANDAGQSGDAYSGKAMWMPRASASHLIGERTAQGRLRPALRHPERGRLRRRRRLQRHDDVHDLRRSGAHLQVGDAGDRRLQLRSVPGPCRRYPLGPGGWRRARRQLAAGRSSQHGERPARSRPAAALARVAPAAALVESRRRGRLRRGPTTTSSR